MIEKSVQFYSEGFKLQGTLYFPEDYENKEKHPAIIANSGYQGVNEFYPRMFAKAMTEKGYICLGFDYRGFADSEGDPARVILDEQVDDIRNALTFLRTQSEVDHERIGLIGWGMGGSNVVRVAEKEDVAAVAALNGFYHGERWLKTIHSYENWLNVLETVYEDRILRVTTGESKPADPFLHYPLDPATRDYVDKELAAKKGFGGETRIQFSDSILEMDAEKAAQKLEDTPLFVAHGKDNILHPFEESVFLFHNAASPKVFYEINGKHNDFMYSDHYEFKALVEELGTFFEEALLS
ncbi:alpha/beta hydrolase [Halobacillus shinanisalinarum]|uniref:Alpha/beta hydrolase n=1 Tax=Halobacillus shinanisalinarum TaxID=2932258 RepID=A0ABY4GW40_9BACI|nr:alpha/beta hydrolase [Halobacillus shinanisalinarum]UOQ92382.1 alpha/beta hydrolase [Halobacillus shinanisalinarum]